jgi:hypothetical protein
MATAASQPTSKTAAKKTAGAKKTASRTRKSPTKKTAATAEPAVHAAILTLQQRLETLEERLSQGLTALVAEVKELRSAPPVDPPQSGLTEESIGALLQETLRKHIEEQIEPVTTTLRRIEERVGFIGNRLKSSGGGGRNKSGRRDQSPNARAKGPNAPRPGQNSGQNWTPPSAASVQGHFTPRPMSLDHLAREDDE